MAVIALTADFFMTFFYRNHLFPRIDEKTLEDIVAKIFLPENTQNAAEKVVISVRTREETNRVLKKTDDPYLKPEDLQEKITIAAISLCDISRITKAEATMLGIEIIREDKPTPSGDPSKPLCFKTYTRKAGYKEHPLKPYLDLILPQIHAVKFLNKMLDAERKNLIDNVNFYFRVHETDLAERGALPPKEAQKAREHLISQSRVPVLNYSR